MSERYSRLFSLPENQYATGSPVVIAAGALLKDNQTGKVIAQLKLRNVGPKAIKAAKVCISPFDTVGNSLGDAVQYQYLDLNAKRNEDFGQKAAITLPDAATRSFAATVEEIAFADNTIWKATGEPWEVLPVPSSICRIHGMEFEKQFRMKYGADCKNLPLSEKDLWYCACGALNRQEEADCHACRKSYAILNSIDYDVVRAEMEARKAAEKEQAEKETAAAKAHAKKMGKIAAIVAPILAVLIVVAVLVSNFIEKKQEEAARLEAYNTAVALMDAGQYEEAIDAFTALGDYQDCAEKIEYAEQEKAYADAIILLESNQFADAITAFESMGGYKDSIQQIDEAKYLWARHNIRIGNDSDAYELLKELAKENYKDADGYLADFVYLPSSVSINGNEWVQCDYDSRGNVISGLIKLKPDYSVFVDETSFTFPNEVFKGFPVFDSIVYAYKEDGSYTYRCGFSVEGTYAIEYIFSYDSMGRCLSKYRKFQSSRYEPSTTEEVFEYYDDGQYRKLSHLTNNQTSWVREYAEDGTFTTTNYKYPNLNDNQKFTIDNHNNITSGSYNYRYTYSYNEDGLMVRREAYHGKELVGYSDFVYDEYGYLIEQKGIKQNGKEFINTIEYEYDYFYCPEVVE